MIPGLLLATALQAAPTGLPDSQIAVRDKFIAAARAGDFATMREMLVAEVTLPSGQLAAADAFLRYVERCTYIGHEDMAGWKCPGENGRAGGSLIGELQIDGKQVKLPKLYAVAEPPTLPKSVN